MKLTRNFLLLSILILVFSCSRKEDPINLNNSNLSIALKSDVGTSDSELIGMNTTVVFTVEGSDGVDYTNESKIFINDEEISGNTYFFETPGLYVAHAAYENITSNELSFEVLVPDTYTLTVDFPKALRNQPIRFGLINDQGADVSDDAVFFVNGNEITGNVFSSAVDAEYEVYATYTIQDEIYTTDIADFEIFIPKRKVVVEDYTGTWCGFCPAVAVAIDELRAVTEDVAVVAIHKSSSSIPDPLNFDRISELQDMFDVDNGFPKAQINRTVPWPRPYNLTEVTSMAGKNTDVSIAVNSRLNGDNLSVTVDVIYENGSTQGDKLVVYLLENGVVSPQANYYDQTPGHPYEGKGNPIEDYVHNDGLRNSLSNLFGDAIPNLPAYEVHSKTYNFTVPSHYVGENLSFVIMVVDSENNAKNAQYAKINENKSYE